MLPRERPTGHARRAEGLDVDRALAREGESASGNGGWPAVPTVNGADDPHEPHELPRRPEPVGRADDDGPLDDELFDEEPDDLAGAVKLRRAAADLPPLPTDGPSDHELIQRAQRGEEAAFEQLVRRHELRAVRVARNMVPSDEDAQDLAQEAFLRVFKSLERFDFAHEFTTWLYRIVTNLAIDHLRKRRPQVSTTPLVDDDSKEPEIADPRDEQPSDDMEARELASEVQACLSALAPHFQSVLVLREFEDLACNEIADIVGATHVTVRWRLHRGRKLFQEEWERRARLREKRALELAQRRVAPSDPAPSARPRSRAANTDLERP